MGSRENYARRVLGQVIDRNGRDDAEVEGLPGCAAVGTVEDPDICSGENAVTARQAAAASAIVGPIDHNLEDWNIGQTAVDFGPSRAEINRPVNVPDLRIDGKPGKPEIGHIGVVGIGCDAGGLGRQDAQGAGPRQGDFQAPSHIVPECTVGRVGDDVPIGLGRVIDRKGDRPAKIAHRERPGWASIGAVVGSKLEVFNRAILSDALISLEGSGGGEIQVRLLVPGRHSVGRHVNRMRAEKDPMRNRGIDRERRVEHRTRVPDLIQQGLQIRGPLRFAKGVAIIEIIGGATPGRTTVAGGRNRRVIDLIERKVVIEEIGIAGVIETEAAVAGLAIGTKPVTDRAAE